MTVRRIVLLGIWAEAIFDLTVETLKLELLNIQKFEEASLIVWDNVVIRDRRTGLNPHCSIWHLVTCKVPVISGAAWFWSCWHCLCFWEVLVSHLCHRSCRWMHDASRSCARPFLVQHKSSSADAGGISIIVSHFLFNSVWNELGNAEEWLNS